MGRLHQLPRIAQSRANLGLYAVQMVCFDDRDHPARHGVWLGLVHYGTCPAVAHHAAALPPPFGKKTRLRRRPAAGPKGYCIEASFRRVDQASEEGRNTGKEKRSATVSCGI